MVPWYRATVTTLAAHLPLSFEADLMVARSSAACVQLCASDENRRVELASTKPAVSANSVDEELGAGGCGQGRLHAFVDVRVLASFAIAVWHALALRADCRACILCDWGGLSPLSAAHHDVVSRTKETVFVSGQHPPAWRGRRHHPRPASRLHIPTYIRMPHGRSAHRPHTPTTNLRPITTPTPHRLMCVGCGSSLAASLAAASLAASLAAASLARSSCRGTISG